MMQMLGRQMLRQARRAPWVARGFRMSAPRLDLSVLEFPAMSPTMTEGNLSTWKHKEGSTIDVGEAILDVETDKATIDVEATDDTILVKILKGDGTKDLKVGEPIAIIAEPGDDTSEDAVAAFEKTISTEQKKDAEKTEAKESERKESEKKESEEAAPKDSAATPPPKSDAPKKPEDADTARGDTDKILGSPAAKRLALERGIPLADVKGTGAGGLVTLADVEKFNKAAGGGAAAAPAGAAAPAYKDEPLSNMRKTIGSRLLQSHSEIPSYAVTAKINVDRLEQLRKFLNDAAATAKVPYKLSVNDFIIKASALASKQVPQVNSAWMGDAIREFTTQDISVAVSTPAGLITPIVRDVGSKGLIEISNIFKELAKRAREGKLKPEEYQGGTFSVSNLGMFGVDQFTAIINPPQSAILAIGGASSELVLDESSEKGFKESKFIKVTLVADHRVTDGAVNAQWLQAFRAYLESPLSFIL